MSNYISVIRPDPADPSQGCPAAARRRDWPVAAVRHGPSGIPLSGPRVVAFGLLIFLAVNTAPAQDPPLPVIPSASFNVLNYGALGDGSQNNAPAINSAISAANAAGGGTVEIPANGRLSTYLSGPITMASHVNLQIDSGAMLQMFPMDIWQGNGYGTTPFINGNSLTDVEISGSGTIDGQGTNWWYPLASSRPHLIDIAYCQRVLIRDVTLQNPPVYTVFLKANNTSVTVQGITINNPRDSHNTDGIDISSTDVLVRNCHISTGDDDIEVGGSGYAATDITISNCTFGTGHGVSIGSAMEAGVNNLVVSNCWWNGTEYGIKMKTDRDRGGLMENIKYCDMSMTNVNFPFAFYEYYNSMGSPSHIITNAPAGVAADPTQPITRTTPIFRNVIVSNLTAVGNSGPQGPGDIAGIIFGVPEMPITNVTLCQVNIQGRSHDGTVCLYNVRDIRIIDSNLGAPLTGTNALTLYNAQFTVTNTVANPNWITITGLGSPSNSVLSVFNGQAEADDASVLGANPVLTLAVSTLTVSNGMSLGASSTLNYGLGTNPTATVVTGALTLGGTLNITDAGGFDAGSTGATYTLFTYGGALTYNGLTLGSTPNPTFTYTISTDTLGQVNLVVCPVGTAGPISGPTSVPAGEHGVTYSIPAVSGATVYTWTVPAGARIASGQGTTSITVDYPCAAGGGTVTVTPSNGGCCGGPSSLDVTVNGAVLAFDAATLYTFAGTTDGQFPMAGLVQGSDGNFYGTTAYGGTNGVGTVFRITPQGTLTTLWQFGGDPTEGAYPWGSLVQGNDGSFYGTTIGGGTNVPESSIGCGTVFQITSQGTLTTLWQFGGDATNGVHPRGNLVQGSDGNFYGTSQAGGTNGVGTVFQITSQGTLTTLWQFGGDATAGQFPKSALMLGADGNFYGTTEQGGTNGLYGGYGTVFRISAQGMLTTLWQFGADSTEGRYPEAALVQGSDGSFYGTSEGGGTNNFGTVFRISTAGTLTTLWDFACDATNGGSPQDGLALGSDGNLYSTIEECGGDIYGSVFQITPQGQSTTVWQFNGANGQFPVGGLVQGSDGSFYGTTAYGGTNGVGTVFKLVLPSPPQASFTASPVRGAAPLSVSFADTSCGSVTGWAWAFGDGDTSAVQNPSEMYVAPGSYTVEEIVSGLGGPSTSTVANLIGVYSPFAWWQQIYFVNPDCPLCGGNVSFTGDDMSNTNKFLAGFNPANAAAYLHIIKIEASNGNVVVTYLGANGDNTWSPGIASRTNVLELAPGGTNGSYTTNFTSTGQTNILSGGTGVGIVTNMTDFGGATNRPSRYYRVRVLLP
ncbi:MAG TPA: choice-of-anchor tandem repeat GloVer-containing protein [Verrucomicrobiae bacterium]|nr:choice-of-anchor tandem repeat GloVer-containing protein [Verrucomicrobiae bacterium]